MHLSVSTGAFYFLPFEKTLALIAKAGFEYIELLMHSRGAHWELGQHLRGIPPAEALRMVEAHGLNISSLHDGGGWMEPGASLVSRDTHEYLQHREIPCVVLHPPVKSAGDPADYLPRAAQELRQLATQAIVCVENLFPVEGECVALTNPADMLAFITEHDIFATIDTTHCAQAGIDLIQTAKTLRERVRTVHLSDYAAPNAHVFVGEGALDLKGCVQALDQDKLHALTLECAVEYHAHDENHTIQRLRQAYDYLKEISA